MKVLVVTNDFPPRVGGIEHYVAELLNHLPATVSPVVFTSHHPDAAAFDRTFSHTVMRWPTYPMLPTPAVTSAVVDLALSTRADVIMFGASMPLALMAGALRRRTGLPILACTHGVECAAAAVPLGRLLIRRIGLHAAIVTAVSGWAEQRLRRALGPLRRIDRLPSGADLRRFHAGVDGSTWRRQLGPGPVIVSLSRLVRRKGHDQTIRALPALAREFPAIRLLIGGQGPDRARLERLARRVGVGDRVLLAGHVANDAVPAFLAAGDVFAMPCRSRWLGLEQEALGAVFLQAAAVGLPVVCGASGGAPEAVVPGETGLVVDGRNVHAVEHALGRVLRRPDDAKAMGAAGAARARETMDWTHLARRLHRLLLEAAGQPAGVEDEPLIRMSTGGL